MLFSLCAPVGVVEEVGVEFNPTENPVLSSATTFVDLNEFSPPKLFPVPATPAARWSSSSVSVLSLVSIRTGLLISFRFLKLVLATDSEIFRTTFLTPWKKTFFLTFLG
jgi:hypothetical protein